MRDYAQVRAKGDITPAVTHAALAMLEVDEHGFDEIDRRLLRTIIDKFGGGPVGVNTIAAAISEEKDAIEDIYEPFLIQIGFIDRTPRGRVATARAYAVFRAAGPRKGFETVVNGNTLRTTRISALATYVPPAILDNKKLSQMVDTTDEWILQRTGIKTRHIVEKGVATSDLGKEAALKAIAQAGLTPDDIDLDRRRHDDARHVLPEHGGARAAQDRRDEVLGLRPGRRVLRLHVLAERREPAGRRPASTNRALVVGADTMSSIIDYTDRTTCVLFGDGAGAVIVEPAVEEGLEIIDFEHEIDGSGGPALQMPAGGSLNPASHETVEKRMHYVKQDGQAVFKFAVRKTEEIAAACSRSTAHTTDDVALFVSHQANRRIIMSAADRLGLPESKVMINIEDYGNTTAATIPLALDDAIRQGRLKKGDLVLLTSVGAGFTVGSVLLRWAI